MSTVTSSKGLLSCVPFGCCAHVWVSDGNSRARPSKGSDWDGLGEGRSGLD